MKDIQAVPPDFLGKGEQQPGQSLSARPGVQNQFWRLPRSVYRSRGKAVDLLDLRQGQESLKQAAGVLANPGSGRGEGGKVEPEAHSVVQSQQGHARSRA